MSDLFNCPRLCHSRSDSNGKQELVSAPNVPDEDTDENCSEADDENVPQMPLKIQLATDGKSWTNFLGAATLLKGIWRTGPTVFPTAHYGRGVNCQ